MNFPFSGTQTGNLREEVPGQLPWKEKIPCLLQDVLRPQRGVGAVLAFDEDRPGLQALGIMPLSDRDAEAHAIGSGGVGRSAGGGDEAFSEAAVRIEVVLPHRPADQHYSFR